MIKEIKLPEIAENVESGTVVEILVSQGDQVEEEQDIVEIETDKATFEVPSTAAGTVQEIKISEGDDINVGDVILTIETESGQKSEKDQEKDDKDSQQEKDEPESKQSSREEKSSKQESKGEDDEDDEADKEEKPSEDEEESAAKEDQETSQTGKVDVSRDQNGHDQDNQPSNVPASPAVRRMAREAGVDLRKVKGSGPGNRITAEDVQKGPDQAAPKSRPSGVSLPDFSKWGTTERVSLNKIKKKTAENMTSSWQTVPHVTQFDQADVSNLSNFMAEYEESAKEQGGKLTLTAMLVKVAVNALKKFPAVNASLDAEKEELILKKYFNIGIAVDTEKGLLVPVIKDVDKKSVIELAVEITEIAKKARDQKLGLDELQGGNFTISNLGGIGGTNFTPVVYAPQVAILGVARTQKQPVWNSESGGFKPRDILPLSLSYDHRVIDGAEGARFLRWICEAIENPMKMLMEGGV